MLASSPQTLSLERESNTVSRCVRPWIKFTPEYPFKMNLGPHIISDEISFIIFRKK